MQLWTKGDVLQGRWMIGFALVVLLTYIEINDNALWNVSY